MTTYKKGADTEALTRIAGNIRGMQSDLTRIEQSSRSAMGSLQGNWGGENLLTLVRHFTATAIPAMQACNGVFDAMATKLDTNAKAQVATSVGGAGGTAGPGGAAGGSGGGTNGGSGGPSVPPPHGKNDVTKTKGKKFRTEAQDGDGSVGGGGNSFTHTIQDGQHSYENSRVGDDGRQHYDRRTHDGDYRRRELEHEQGWRTESQHDVHRPWLPTDDSADPRSFANRHEDASRRLGHGVEAVNWTHKDEQTDSSYTTHYYDSNGNPTDKEHAASSTMGGTLGTETKHHTELGIKDGALYAGAGAGAGAELGGNVAGVGGTVGGEVYAGIGAHAKVDANFSAESVKVKVDVGAAIGIGGGVKFSVDVQPKEMMSDVGHGLGDAGKAIDGGLEHGAKAIGKVFGWH